jgi:hypothetical protein
VNTTTNHNSFLHTHLSTLRHWAGPKAYPRRFRSSGNTSNTPLAIMYCPGRPGKGLVLGTDTFAPEGGVERRPSAGSIWEDSSS